MLETKKEVLFYASTFEPPQRGKKVFPCPERKKEFFDLTVGLGLGAAGVTAQLCGGKLVATNDDDALFAPQFTIRSKRGVFVLLHYYTGSAIQSSVAGDTHFSSIFLYGMSTTAA